MFNDGTSGSLSIPSSGKMMSRQWNEIFRKEDLGLKLRLLNNMCLEGLRTITKSLRHNSQCLKPRF